MNIFGNQETFFWFVIYFLKFGSIRLCWNWQSNSRFSGSRTEASGRAETLPKNLIGHLPVQVLNGQGFEGMLSRTAVHAVTGMEKPENSTAKRTVCVWTGEFSNLILRPFSLYTERRAPRSRSRTNVRHAEQELDKCLATQWKSYSCTHARCHECVTHLCVRHVPVEMMTHAKGNLPQNRL